MKSKLYKDNCLTPNEFKSLKNSKRLKKHGKKKIKKKSNTSQNRNFFLAGIVLFISLLFLPLCLAAPPLQSTSNSDYLQILTPAWDTIKKEQDVNFYWHVFNVTHYLTNATTECTFHLYSINEEGEHILVVSEAKFNITTGRDFEVFVDGANFTEIGEYRYLIECKTPVAKGSSSQVGGIEEAFEVTPIGIELTSAKAFFYILIFFVSFIIFLGLTIIGIYLPSNNKSNELTGYIIAISNLKYLKIFCLCLAYLVALFISYFAWMVCYAYLDMEFVAEIFKILFFAEAILIIPLFIVGSYIFVANLIHDQKIADFLSRGLTVKGDN